MAISKIGGTGSDNWELISSITPTAATAAVNFTGLSSYKKLMVVADGVTLSVTDELDIRINNDSANKYLYSYWSGAEQVTQVGFTSRLTFTNSATTISAMVVIENCDNAGVKFINKGFGGGAGTTLFMENGIYLASAIVTQINVVVDNTFAGAGTMSLYGVK